MTDKKTGKYPVGIYNIKNSIYNEIRSYLFSVLVLLHLFGCGVFAGGYQYFQPGHFTVRHGNQRAAAAVIHSYHLTHVAVNAKPVQHKYICDFTFKVKGYIFALFSVVYGQTAVFAVQTHKFADGVFPVKSRFQAGVGVFLPGKGGFFALGLPGYAFRALGSGRTVRCAPGVVFPAGAQAHRQNNG